VKRLYAKGVSANELHTDKNKILMPCHTGQSPCEYVSKRERLINNLDDIDILIGNHQHAYNPRYPLNRIVIFDEFNPDPFIESFPSANSNVPDSPHELVSAFLEAVDEIPLENITDLIEARAREDKDYDASLDWFLEEELTSRQQKKFLRLLLVVIILLINSLRFSRPRCW
jgi:hypothetical protein